LRHQASSSLASAVEHEIQRLGMPGGRFTIELRPNSSDELLPNGLEQVELLVSANPGQPLKALAKVASGGELSRIILALKNVLSRTGSVSTVVFDEVDNGIGGGVAEIVGRKLKQVSANHQVICITHLPQIACYGDRHIVVSKNVVKGRTVTSVRELDAEGKIEEISRMLGGVNLTKATRDHAREMIHQARSLQRKPGEKRC